MWNALLYNRDLRALTSKLDSCEISQHAITTTADSTSLRLRTQSMRFAHRRYPLSFCTVWPAWHLWAPCSSTTWRNCHSRNSEPSPGPVGRWTHSSCIGWNVQLQRGHLGIDDEQLVGLGDSARSAMHEAIRRLLKNKLNACEAMLQSVTKYGPDTPDEGKDIIHQLYDYWALRQELDGWS